jgi:hypothetical protein
MRMTFGMMCLVMLVAVVMTLYIAHVLGDHHMMDDEPMPIDASQ